MKKFILAAMFLSSAAMAQPVPEVTLKVNQQELGTIGKAIAKLPYDEVAPLLNKLQTQVIEQQRQAEKPQEPKKQD